MTRLLRDHGQIAIEVRDVLGGDAPDAAISAYAKANARWVATKDREFAQGRRAAGEPTLWLQTRQTEDVERLWTRLQALVDAVDAGASQAVIARDGTLEVES